MPSDVKISGLPAVAAFATTQEFAVNDSGTSRKISGAQLQAAFPLGTLPGGYAQVTADQGTFTALTDLTGLTVTVTVGTGRRIRITGKIGFASSVADGQVELQIRESATTLSDSVDSPNLAAAVISTLAQAILTPSSGSHTYKLSAARINGTGNITMKASATQPAFILVEDIGV